MIIEILPNTSPYVYDSGNCHKLLGESLPELPDPQTNDICICDYLACPYIEQVFASNDNDWWKNDKNDFLFKRFVSADTISIELFKNGNKVADLNNNTYGTFFNGFPSGTSEQQLYVGYLVDWQLVFQLIGVGIYQIKAQLNIVGQSSTYESRKFDLSVYSDLAAHHSVRIETYQNGNIRGNEFDFTGLNWYSSLRIPAVFGDPKPTIETDNYVTENHNIRQITAKNSREWTLKTKKINWEVAEKLIYNKMLANEIYMTDYNLYAESVWRRISVTPTEISKIETTGNPDKIYLINFADSKDIFKKRNF